MTKLTPQEFLSSIDDALEQLEDKTLAARIRNAVNNPEVGLESESTRFGFSRIINDLGLDGYESNNLNKWRNKTLEDKRETLLSEFLTWASAYDNKHRVFGSSYRGGPFADTQYAAQNLASTIAELATGYSHVSDYYDDKRFDWDDLDLAKQLFGEKAEAALVSNRVEDLNLESKNEYVKVALSTFREGMIKAGYPLVNDEEFWNDLQRSDSFKQFVKTQITRYTG